jgi:hypothetical protein
MATPITGKTRVSEANSQVLRTLSILAPCIVVRSILGARVV